MNLKTGVIKKKSTPNFSKNEHFLPPDTHTYVYPFFEKLNMLCFLVTPVLRFALLPYYRRNTVISLRKGLIVSSLLIDALREKCPKTELFLVRTQENMDQK